VGIESLMIWKMFCILGVLMSFFDPTFAENIKIITIDGPLQPILKMKTEEIGTDEMPLAQEIVQKLFFALQPYLPAAGLAAPQIGISKSVFIFSFDRDPNNLEGVINPYFVPIGEEKIEGWECCFSVMLSNGAWKSAKIPRYESIKVQYLNAAGERIEKTLEGFAAKAFQHEYDHLRGIVNIDREDAIIRDFASKEELLDFMQQVKQEDSLHYKKPNSKKL